MTQREFVRETKQGAEQAAAGAARSPWVRTAARLGYAAIGAVYILLGGLALRVAAGPGGDAPDQQSALQQVLQAPFGRVLLGVIAVGLFGYLLWRIIEAVLDVRGKGGEPKGLATRAGYVGSGLAYGALGLTAARLALGMGGGGSGDGQRQEWTARLMELPLGRWLVALAGLVVIGVGVYQLYKGWSHKFRKDLLYGKMSEGERKLIDPVGVAGHTAHGVVLGLTGVFLVQAALRYNPQEAQGLGGALDELARQPFGPWLLGLVALGLVAYGIYKLAEAKYHMVLGR
jgi:hypothetical protein